ncbi:NAD-dependent epimerase/dehydratase family protein [Siccirubricoccus phaeus]|uniref:NAD-dependent epimerase/dehydratase family protein n=1 Tax=Siccirubricoccus phaeus TaxID=2595053 RepID=UPI0011F10A14|nr:NAD-dependent epimerase/dehydratase family protein [Siccirubricoccus phaeus]
MASYLVTGGCGFIGSHLTAALLAAGHAVRVLDDLSSGHLANLAPGAELIRADCADPAALRDAMAGVAGCFHLAAIASVERGRRDWAGTHRVNLSATVAVLEAAVAETRARGRPEAVPVVYASSAAVYGEPESLPLTEAAATRPLSAYGADKLGCELHARVGGVVHGLPTTGLRFFNVFGPRQDPSSPYSGVISIFCEKLVRGEKVTVFGDGGQTRDFIFVADIVAGLLAAMRQASAAAPVFNLCTGRPVAVRELAAAIAGLCGTVLELRQAPARSGEIRHSLGDPAASRAALGLGEPVTLEAGLRETIAWLRAGRPGLR